MSGKDGEKIQGPLMQDPPSFQSIKNLMDEIVNLEPQWLRLQWSFLNFRLSVSTVLAAVMLLQRQGGNRSKDIYDWKFGIRLDNRNKNRTGLYLSNLKQWIWRKKYKLFEKRTYTWIIKSWDEWFYQSFYRYFFFEGPFRYERNNYWSAKNMCLS